jgi:hypothetical protein
LNDINGKPVETDVTMFLYHAGTKNVKYTMVHTLNKLGNPDTLLIDPNFKYDLVVNTIPKVEKKNITIQKNIHNTIVVDAPQGYIKVRLLNATRGFTVESRIMQAGKPATLNVQQANVSDKYIVGKYDVEILTLPRIYTTIDVTQSATTTIDVPAPGTLNYKFSDFYTHINIRRNLNKPIGNVLMDQKVISGIGNYLRADTLWMSKISPVSSCSDSSESRNTVNSPSLSADVCSGYRFSIKVFTLLISILIVQSAMTSGSFASSVAYTLNDAVSPRTTVQTTSGGVFPTAYEFDLAIKQL